MIMLVVKVGEKILVLRNVYKLVLVGIILSGFEFVYMNFEIDENLGIVLGVKL